MLPLVETEFVAFVDDDDTIGATVSQTSAKTPSRFLLSLPGQSFVKALGEEAMLHPQADAIIFRMSCSNCFARIMPREKDTNFYLNYVGISFALRRTLLHKWSFHESCGEDYDLLARLRHAGHFLVISPYILYFVKDWRMKMSAYQRSRYERVIVHRQNCPDITDALFDYEKECKYQRLKWEGIYKKQVPRRIRAFLRRECSNDTLHSSRQCLGRTQECFCTPCNWDCYRARYPDIRELGDKEAMQHYRDWGILELRSCMCDPLDVKEHNATLATLISGCDWDCYRARYDFALVSAGVTSEPDPLHRYKDIRHYTIKDAAYHYVRWGAKQGRLCTCDNPERVCGHSNARQEFLLQYSVLQITVLPTLV